MAGRALAFSDPEIVRMATEDYIPVVGDDWYQRRRDDAEGAFLRHIADQGPRKGEGGSTRQGIYTLTAGGTLLAFRNAGQNPEIMREVIRDGLAAWNRLPESQRRPGAIEVGALDALDENFVRTPPPGGLIVKVYARALDHDDQGELCDADGQTGRGNEASRDHLWLTQAEWQALVPDDPTPDKAFPVPASVAERILRFHLVDNTRGEPPFWNRDQIRTGTLTLTVEQVTPEEIRMRLDGEALLSTNADIEKADRGFEARLHGYVSYHRANEVVTRFDVVAIGEHWGQGPYTRRARPGRTPLGIAFELVPGDDPADQIPPQAARQLGAYLGR